MLGQILAAIFFGFLPAISFAVMASCILDLSSRGPQDISLIADGLVFLMVCGGSLFFANIGFGILLR